MISVISDQQLVSSMVIGLLHWSVMVIDDLTNAIKSFYKVPNIEYIGPEG